MNRIRLPILLSFLILFLLGMFAGSVVQAERAERGSLGIMGHLAFRVDRVVSGSPAESADIQQDDLILRVNDEEVESVAQIEQAIDRVPPGEKIRIHLLRYDPSSRSYIQHDVAVRPEAPGGSPDGPSSANPWPDGNRP